MTTTTLSINCQDVLVDTDKLEFLSAFRWYIDGHGYAYTIIGGKVVAMHRLLCKDGEVVDHINHNPADNRLCNLRPATRGENAINRGKTVRNKTGYKGVFFSPKKNKFKAGIRVNYYLWHLGTFDTAEEAAIAYNKAALESFGEFAVLNKLTGEGA